MEQNYKQNMEQLTMEMFLFPVICYLQFLYLFLNKNITTKILIEMATDPYNYPFLQKTETMYLSTISKNDFKPTQTNYLRDSSFQKHDIQGATPKIRIPPAQRDSGFSLSTFVEPIPDRAKHISKVSDPLYRDDIEGSRPKAHEFKTTRTVDPLAPVYKLPTPAEISVDPGRTFIRDTLDTKDISGNRKTTIGDRGREILREPIAGSQPSKLTKLLKANSNLEVKDINKDGMFESTRSVNPLNPNYCWRDQEDKGPNNYGEIKGTAPRRMHPKDISPSRPPNSCLNIKDIEGTQANSCFSKAHFLDKRREFRNYMNTGDIEKAQPSTLKKGIESKRATNPLMPSYKYPGHTEVAK